MITVVILAKNEEKNLDRCLSGLGWCSEIIVIDDFSTDKTKEITEGYKAKVIQRKLNGDFASQRNFGLKQVMGEWVLFIDADEEVTEELKEEISKTIKATKSVNGFYFKRKDNFLLRWLIHGETAGVRLLRLARKGTGEWQGKIDEVWKIRGKTETLANPLLHYSHPDLTQFLKNINERSSLNARRFYDEEKRVSFFDWFKPFLKFIQNYILRLGFLDGVYGFVFATLMSLHSFLVRGKLYLIWKKEGGWH